MSNRPILCGVETVEVNQTRYDELLHKEAMLDNIERLHKKTSGYSFHDVVGYLLDAAVQKETVEADE
jgi:hypothetical protein